MHRNSISRYCTKEIISKENYNCYVLRKIKFLSHIKQRWVIKKSLYKDTEVVYEYYLTMVTHGSEYRIIIIK